MRKVERYEDNYCTSMKRNSGLLMSYFDQPCNAVYNRNNKLKSTKFWCCRPDEPLTPTTVPIGCRKRDQQVF